MATGNNEVKFRVSVDAGNSAGELDKVEDALGGVKKAAEALGGATTEAAKAVDALADAAGEAAGAHREELAAITPLAQAKEREADSAKQSADAKVAEAAASERAADARREELSSVTPLANAKEKEAAASSGAAQAKRTEADASERTADALRDEQAAVVPLAKAKDQETKSTKESAKAKAQEADVTEQAAQSFQRRATAIAAGLQVQRSEIELQRQSLNLQKEEALASLAAARAAGDEAAVMRAQASLRQNEVAQIRLTATAKRAEADAAEQAANARRAELSVAGPLTQAKAQEIQAAQNAARALRTEAEAAGVTANRLELYGNESREAAGDTDALAKSAAGVRNMLAGLGATLSAGFVLSELTQAADAYTGLAARIKIATGEGAAFQSAMEGVQRVAIETRSGLESTGTLFTKLAEAGKEMGFGQERALALTQTINQAIQLTGGSAESADAAIVQLIQALQSGVLRGEEFNSIMEQAPRLARALAAGLNVPISALRQMAEEGRLTSAAVIGALKGQSDAVAAEFAKLPATVGGALTNLSTAWTLYVGQVDQATGASRTAAEAINVLGRNLADIGDIALAAGKGMAAIYAVNLAKTFAGWAVGANSAAAATAQATAATAAATIKTTENTAATQANTTAKTLNAAASSAMAASAGGIAGALSASTAAKAAGTAQAGLLARAWGLMAGAGRGLVGLMGGPLGLVALTAVYAKDLGELAAKGVMWATGQKSLEQSTKELADADRLAAEKATELRKATEEKAAAAAAAEAKLFALGTGAQKLIADFDDLIKKGKTADEAIKSIGKDFDLSNLKGIADAAGVLDKLAAAGKITAEQLKAAWADALKGEDLLKFETMARAAFAGTAREAERLAQVMDATLTEAIRRTGLDFDLISTGMGKAATSAINDLDRLASNLDALKAKGVDVGQVLSASITQAINTADGEKAIEALRLKIESLRGTLGSKVADGLLDQATAKAKELADALDAAKPGINSMAEAMKVLGIISQETLTKTATTARDAYATIAESGKATAREVGQAFHAAAEAAIQANNGIAPSWVEAEAAVRGYKVVTDEAGLSTLELALSIDKAGKSHRDTAGAVDQHRTALERMNSERDRAISAAEKEIELNERAAAVERKRLNVDKEGFTLGSDGNRAQQSMPYARYGYDTAISQGLDEKKALEISERFFKNGQSVGTEKGMDWFSTVNKAVSEAVLEAARQRVNQPKGATAGQTPGTNGGTTPSGTTPQPTPSATPVIVNLNGVMLGTVNTATAQDAAMLQKILTQLATDKGRT